MNIWSVREKSLHWLEDELNPESQLLQNGFDYLYSIIELFEKIGQDEGKSETGQFCRIICVTLAKYRNLLLGVYSLMLDGLAQEAGALLRPLIETYELLVYFRQDKSRINEMLEDKLPSAGIIGKRIQGDFQDLRGYLNNNASHFSYKINSVRHLLDQNAKILPMPSHSLNVLRTNLEVLNAFQIFALFEAVNCLFSIGIDANALAVELENWRNTSAKIFSREKL